MAESLESSKIIARESQTTTQQEDPAESRRGFIAATAAAAVAAFAALVPAFRKGSSALADDDWADEDEPEVNKRVRWGMVIDVRRCIGCHACTVACKSEFDVPLGENRTWVEYVEKGVYPNTGRSFLPRLCNHCYEPPCVNACPTDATYKREQDGIVVVDQGLCIGCKYCIQACPYDARFLNPVNGWADKCDFCIHRVSKGLVPSCVNTCVGGARIFGNVADPNSEISVTIAQNQVSVLRQEMGTFPNVYYIGADLTDELDAKRFDVQKVRVITHRRYKQRR